MSAVDTRTYTHALKDRRDINHFGGHPGQVTILARGSGATLVTALTASDLSKGLFKQAWVTNGAGAFENKSLAQANTENKAILEKLGCGSDEVECLIGKKTFMGKSVNE